MNNLSSPPKRNKILILKRMKNKSKMKKNKKKRRSTLKLYKMIKKMMIMSVMRMEDPKE